MVELVECTFGPHGHCNMVGLVVCNMVLMAIGKW